MMKIIRIFVVTTLLLAAFAPPAMAAHESPLEGTVMGAHWPPDFTDAACLGAGFDWRFSSRGEGGVGLMSHLGRVAAYSLTQCTYLPEPVFPGGPPNWESIHSEGTIKLVAANGDELWLEHRMHSGLVPAGAGPFEAVGFAFVGSWEAVGGTGRFIHATGFGTFDGVGDIPDGGEPFGIPDGLLQISLKGSIAYDLSGK